MRPNGFTLIEVVIVLAVITILVGTATPMAKLLVDGSSRDEVRDDLAAITEALEDFYYDNGAFPVSLTATGFYGSYLVPGVDDDVVLDSWGGNLEYLYVTATGPDSIIVRSRGPNGVDDSGLIDDIQGTLPGAAAGNRKTRERMRIIIEVLANYLESGATLSGTWATDRVNMGLGAVYANDGFGTAFTLSAATYELRSAGADRVSGNADDLTS